MIALDPMFVACAYAVLCVVTATILGVAIAVLVIEYVAEVRADRHYRRKQQWRIDSSTIAVIRISPQRRHTPRSAGEPFPRSRALFFERPRHRNTAGLGGALDAATAASLGHFQQAELFTLDASPKSMTLRRMPFQWSE